MKSFQMRDLDYLHKRSMDENWRTMSNDVPFIALDAGWRIAIIPPFAGAAARFLVRDDSGAQVSIYLDTCEALGCSDTIYWEVYPDGSGENGRCDMEDSETLLKMIREGLAYKATVKTE